MTERYIALHSCVIDTHDKGGYGNPPEGKVVATSDMAARIAVLLNEDDMIKELIKEVPGVDRSDFVDDVVRHTKVQT